jgi:trehalose/maltose transport system substrate-binding protein
MGWCERRQVLKNTNMGLIAIPVGDSAAKASAEVAPRAVPNFEIRDVPTNLRTDLKGTAIRFAVEENAPDRVWDDLLLAKFHQLTGITVTLVRLGNDITAALSSYLSHFRAGSPQADVYDIDIVWPGILAKYAEDLTADFGNLHGMAPVLVQNDTVKGRLVAVPYFMEISMLYYRRDLLKKYHFDQPPSTWQELEEQAKTIMTGERSEGREQFWGFLWQGAASEALTCNALEWQVSQGGGAAWP